MCLAKYCKITADNVMSISLDGASAHMHLKWSVCLVLHHLNVCGKLDNAKYYNNANAMMMPSTITTGNSVSSKLHLSLVG